MHIRHTNPPVGCGGPCGWVPRTAHVGFVSGALGIQISNPNWQPTANSGVGLVLVACFGWEPNAGISVSNRRLIKYSNMQNHVAFSNHQRLWPSRLGRWKFERRRGSIPGESIFRCKGVSFCCCSLVSFSCCVLCCCAWWVVWLMWGVLGCG